MASVNLNESKHIKKYEWIEFVNFKEWKEFDKKFQSYNLGSIKK